MSEWNVKRFSILARAINGSLYFVRIYWWFPEPFHGVIYMYYESISSFTTYFEVWCTYFKTTDCFESQIYDLCELYNTIDGSVYLLRNDACLYKGCKSFAFTLRRNYYFLPKASIGFGYCFPEPLTVSSSCLKVPQTYYETFTSFISYP